MHFLNAQQTRKVRGILASDIFGVLANCSLVKSAFIYDIAESSGYTVKNFPTQSFPRSVTVPSMAVPSKRCW